MLVLHSGTKGFLKSYCKLLGAYNFNPKEEENIILYKELLLKQDTLLLETSSAPEALLEEGEVDAAVGAVLDEAGMLGEVVLLAVLEDKETVGLEEVAAEDDVGQFGDLRQDVRRVGKDEVELLAALCHVLKGVGTNGKGCGVLQLVEELLDEAMVTDIELHADDASAASADELQRNAARAGEEVEGRRCFAEVDVALQDIEEVLLGEVCRGTCRERARHVEVPAFVFAGDDSHNIKRR